MRVDLSLKGVNGAMQTLRDAGKRVDPVVRGTLNSTATLARNKQYLPKLSRIYPQKAFLRQRLVVKRAGLKRTDARVIASSSGVALEHFADWIAYRLSATRARLYVRTLTGRRVAAGFINPSSKNQKPLRTRGFNGANGRKTFKPALGPSVASVFKQLTNAQLLRWVNAYMQQEFSRRYNKGITRP
jgi:hypothetical protein